MSITRFAFPTPIHFGAGARALVAQHLLDQGCKRPLIVTDRGVAQLPLLDEFRIGLKGLDVAGGGYASGLPVGVRRRPTWRLDQDRWQTVPERR